MIPKGIQGPLKQFQGLSVALTQGESNDCALEPAISAGSAARGGLG